MNAPVSFARNSSLPPSAAVGHGGAMGEPITMSRADLATLAAEIARNMQHQQALPEMYSFPEDIVAITKGKVPEATIKYWRQMGWLRVTKLGRHCFVLPADWQHFAENYHLLKRGKRV